ncbi:MAG: alpha-L-arabinofuranosidase [Mucilaginibacter sp.]|nr:alpha-L-arabinofuranosidase [Mucilaginibacter sp.]
MSKKRIGIVLFVIVSFIVIMVSCTKTTTVPLDNTPAITTTVSFAKDIQPILIKNCAVSGCHSGSVAPNLSVATAYNDLENGNLINTSTPKSSDVYLWLTGKKVVTMPAGAANNPSNINALMLAWITQGAKNN